MQRSALTVLAAFLVASAVQRKESSEPARYWAEQTLGGTQTYWRLDVEGTAFQFHVGPRDADCV